MAGQQDQKPVPSKSVTNASTSSSSDTTGSSDTSGTMQKTLPDWMTQGLQGAFGSYLGGASNLGDMISNWSAAGFTPDQLAGFDAARTAAGQGGPMQTALQQLQGTAQGDYLTGPGRDEQLAAIRRSVQPGIYSMFGAAGRDQNYLGSDTLAQSVADKYLMDVFNPERNRMQQAQQLIPGMSTLPAETLQGIGKQQQDLAQYGINTPISLMPSYLQGLQGGIQFADPFSGATTTGTSDYSSATKSKGTNTGTEKGTPSYFPGQDPGPFGYGLAGAGIGGQFGGPWGALAGGLGGGLYGLLS